MVGVTRHAVERIRERMGLPKRAALRAAERAWTTGVRLPGRAKDADAGHTAIQYGAFVFIFNSEATLVTVLLRRRLIDVMEG